MERESMDFDVVIVGGGPAGLSAAIRLKQVKEDISVCVIEKGSEIGAHILSGAVIDPRALDELIPDWRDRDAPLRTKVTKNEHWFMSEAGRTRMPHILLPPLMGNRGNYTGSLGNLCRWLAQQAEALGVEIYPGFAAAEMIYGDGGRVEGVITGDMGVAKDGSKKDGYMPGMELRGKYTLIGEGVHGSLAKELIEKFDLRKGRQHQTYGLGIKELWEIDPEKHEPGRVIHTQGWPLEDTAGGGFIYHQEDNHLAIGFVVALDYENPYLSPYGEFQRFKLHPRVREMLEGGKRIAYGARAINEGGLQSVPKLTFPGGALIGCSAGFVNVPRIKGSHNAMKTGMLAAEVVAEALGEGEGAGLSGFEEAFKKSWVYTDLKKVRNARPALEKFGFRLGTLYTGVELWLNSLGLGFLMPWTLDHGPPDHAATEKADKHKKIEYPKPDDKIVFDKLSSVYLSNTNHEEDQPVHLKIKDDAIPVEVNLKDYAAPEERYCPANVYEYVRDDAGKARLQINAQNCVHCKTCDIKDMKQNIHWTVPEGGGGPNYPNM